MQCQFDKGGDDMQYCLSADFSGSAAVTILVARILFKKTRWLDQKGKEV